jgi:cell division septal protein FtsQ
MPSFDRANSNNDGNYWSGILGILSIQLAVLFALSVAAIVYLNWSSKAAVSEFMATGNPSVSEPSHPPQSSVPLQQVKSRTACPRRA